MLDYDEIVLLPCYLCWWREGTACFSTRIYNAQVALGKAPADNGDGALLPHVEIDADLPKSIIEVDDEKPCADYLNKHAMIRGFFSWSKET